MWGNGYNMMGSGWLVALVALALIVIAVIVVLRVVPRRAGRSATSTPPMRDGQQVPRQMLDERYARGDITTDEYRERVKNLGSE